jgi:hypothetical protein
MGAWGHGPFENDDAGDFLDTIKEVKNPMKELERALCGYNENERRAAAAFVALLAKFDRRSLSRIKKIGVKALNDLLNDKDFVEDWRSPRTIKRRLKKEIKELE